MHTHTIGTEIGVVAEGGISHAEASLPLELWMCVQTHTSISEVGLFSCEILFAKLIYIHTYSCMHVGIYAYIHSIRI